jgi:hypothetical protein
MTSIISVILLVILSIACLANYSHADNYRHSWKIMLIVIAGCAVVAVPRIYSSDVPLESMLLLAAVTWQNVSMTVHSWRRHGRMIIRYRSWR